jgi:hypothetical protein
LSPDGAVTGRLEIDASSVDTAKSKRDDHLRSDDFVDAAREAVAMLLGHNWLVHVAKGEHRPLVALERSMGGQGRRLQRLDSNEPRHRVPLPSELEVR